MRILHTADWHLGDRLGRIDRTADLRRSVERIALYCDLEKVDVVLMAGDLFSELSRPESLRDSIEHLRQVFQDFLQRGGTFLTLTGNHDSETFCQTLRHAMALAAPQATRPGDLLSPGRFHLAAEPTFFRLADQSGEAVQFVFLPYPTPSQYLDAPAQRYRSIEEKNRALQAAFVNRLAELQRHPDFNPRLPTVLGGHIHVQGARLANPFRISERESILVPDTDLPADYAYVALGHIHQPQCIRGVAHVRYSGSIERLDLGELYDEKSITIVDIGSTGRQGEPRCLPLPATPIYAVEIRNPQAELPQLRERYPDAEDALVRYRVEYRAGSDNLEQILRELDQIFPRWYDREWSEAGSLGKSCSGPEVAARSPESVYDTVRQYLETELADHPDHDALMRLADELLAEEPA
jgi:exonuclease SbcD